MRAAAVTTESQALPPAFLAVDFETATHAKRIFAG